MKILCLVILSIFTASPSFSKGGEDREHERYWQARRSVEVTLLNELRSGKFYDTIERIDLYLSSISFIYKITKNIDNEYLTYCIQVNPAFDSEESANKLQVRTAIESILSHSPKDLEWEIKSELFRPCDKFLW